jgi:hypothetical protein
VDQVLDPRSSEYKAAEPDKVDSMFVIQSVSDEGTLTAIDFLLYLSNIEVLLGKHATR